MRKILFTMLFMFMLTPYAFGAWPSDSVRTKNWGSEVLTDSDLEAQYDVLHTFINDALDETSGHKHDGTANEGVLIDLNDDAGVIGIKNNLDVPNGGTGVVTLTDGGILLGSGTGDVTVMGTLANGSLVVGDGSGDPLEVTVMTGTAGYLKHEFGGIEADISAIAKGGFVVGSGTGSMAIQAAGGDGRTLIFDASETNGLNTLAYVEVFTSSGTWTAPAGVNYITVAMAGGGGGGGGGDGNGGAGGSGSESVVGAVLDVTPSSTYTVTVGAAGTAGAASGGNGGNGGDSSMTSDGSTLTCTGGTGGTGDSASTTSGATATGANGATGNATTASTGGGWITTAGGDGGGNGSTDGGGAGGGTLLGKGGAGADGDSGTTGSAGEGFGSGGGGGRGTGATDAGGAGAPGVVIIWYNINGTPS